MIRKFVLPLFAAAMLVLAVYHVVRAQQEKPPVEPLVPPARSPFDGAVAGVGVVEASSENIAVAAPLPGIVAEVFAQVGQPVAAGAPLFRLDDRPAQAEVKQREASVAVARAQLARLEGLPRPAELPASAARVREAQANVLDKESQLSRGESMFARKLIGDEQLNSFKQSLQMAREQVTRAQADHELLKAGAWDADKAVARAVLVLAQAQLEQARTELERLTVKAPTAGTILQVQVHAGEFVSPPHGPPPVLLGKLEPLHVRVDIDSHDIPRFQPGVPARAMIRGGSRRELTLTFVRVVPVVVPKRSLTGDITERIDTRVLQAIYALEPGKDSIYVGQQLDVFIPAANGGTDAPHRQRANRSALTGQWHALNGMIERVPVLAFRWRSGSDTGQANSAVTGLPSQMW